MYFPFLYLNRSTGSPAWFFHFTEDTSNFRSDSGPSGSINGTIHPGISVIADQDITIWLFASIDCTNHIIDRQYCQLVIDVNFHCYFTVVKAWSKTVGNIKRAFPIGRDLVSYSKHTAVSKKSNHLPWLREHKGRHTHEGTSPQDWFRFTSHESAIRILYTNQLYFFRHGSKRVRPLELEGVTSVVDCVKRVPIPVIKQDDPAPRVAENWTTHPSLELT